MARANMTGRSRSSHLGLLLLTVICLILTPELLLAGSSSGGTQDGIKICRTFRLRNNSNHDPANDLHFKIWQAEDNIYVNGWTVEIEGCSNVSSNRSNQPAGYSRGTPPKNNRDGGPFTNDADNGQHAVDVDASGCAVGRGQSVKVTVCFWLTHWNTLRISDIKWTFNGGNAEQGGPDNGTESENPTPKPPGANNVPYVGDTNWAYRHVTRIVNDDSVRFVIIRGLTFNISGTDYPDLDSVPFTGKILPDTLLGPGEFYFVNVLTPTPYFGNYIYASWDTYEYFPGPTKDEGVEELSSSDLYQHEVPDTMGTIPTLSEWGLIILMVLVLATVVWTVVRRRRRFASA